MDRGCRVGTLSFLGIAIIIGAASLLIASTPVQAFVTLYVDGRAIESRPALQLLGSGLGIAAPLAEQEFGLVVDEGDFPVVELRRGARTALLVVDDASALIDGRQKQLTAPPEVIDGTLFLPLTLVADVARLRLDWDIGSGVLTLERRDGERPPAEVAAGAAEGTVPASEEGTDRSTESERDTAVATEDSSVTDEDVHANEATEDESPPTHSLGAPSEMDDGDLAHAYEPFDAVRSAENETDGRSREEARERDTESDLGPGIVLELERQTPPAVIQDVQIVHEDGHIQIEVFADRDVEPRLMFLPSPARLVIDVDDAVAATGWRTSTGDGRIVEQVRVNGGDEGAVRIVADLTAPTGYTLAPASEDEGFVVRLNHQLQLLDVAEAGADELALSVHASGAVPYRVFRLREPERLVVDLFGVSVAEAQEKSLTGEFADTLRWSQYEQTTVRGVFTLADGVDGLTDAMEGVLRPGVDGVARLKIEKDRVIADAPNPVPEAGNGLQFVGFGRSEDLEYILIRAEEPLDVRVLRLRGPDRIVLDLPGIDVERSLGLAPDGGEVVKAVRAGQADDAAGRIVAETFGVSEHYLALSHDRTRAVLGLRPSGLAGRTIVVDAGHGGVDPGAIGHSGTYEKDVTLAIALQVAELLGSTGANVVLTRDRDVQLSLAERAQTANLLDADAFVSIHADAVGFGRVASGTSTFYHTEEGNGPDTSVNRRYARTLQGEMLKAVGLPDRGVHERAFHVVLNTKMPSALVEVGFIDNPEEEKLLLEPEFQARAAAGIADGIVRFFGEEVAEQPEQIQQWQARTEEETGSWLWLGVVPSGVTVLEPTPLLTASRLEGQSHGEIDF